ncbi:MAG: hypothetical protein RL375_2439 [Pseudomonadota bacterium]|jgi:hypothetical protein
MAFTESFTPYLADFGVDGTLDGAAVRVLFDTPVEQQLAPGMLSAVPQVQIATASVPAAVEGLTLVVPAGTYTVRERIDDGTGMSLLMLSAT